MKVKQGSKSSTLIEAARSSKVSLSEKIPIEQTKGTSIWHTRYWRVLFQQSSNSSLRQLQRTILRKYLTKSGLERWATGCAYAIIQANKKKGGLCWQQKACPKVKLRGLICLSKILNSSPKLILIYLTEFTLNWFS